MLYKISSFAFLGLVLSGCGVIGEFADDPLANLSTKDSIVISFDFSSVSSSAILPSVLNFTCSGTCPDGLTISASGKVSWTPSAKYLGVNRLSFVAQTLNGSFIFHQTVTVTSRFTTQMLPYRMIGQSNYTSCAANQGGSSPSASSLQYPDGVSTYQGKIFVGDLINYRTLFFNHEPTTDGAAADYQWGQADFTSNMGGGGGTTSSAFPRMSVFNGSQFFMADASNNRIIGFNSIPSSSATTPDFYIGQTSSAGHSANQGNPAPGPNTLFGGSAVSMFTIDTRLVMSDRGNNRVLIFEAPFTTNMSASLVLGQPDFVTRTIANPPTASSLNAPGGLWTDGKRLLVADGNPGNSRVLIWNTFPTQNNQPADVVIGQPDFVSNQANQGNTAPSANTLNGAFGVTSDGTRIFISDDNNHRVLIYNHFPTQNNAPADVVLGQPDMGANLNTCLANGFARTSNIWWDGIDLLVADLGNHRILFFGQ